VLRIVYQVTKAIDPTRPVIDTSGNFHVVTDVFDVHDYDQNPDTFAARYAPMQTGGEVYVSFPDRQRYDGQPYFVSEYGGIWWNTDAAGDSGWGYGERPRSVDDFLQRYEALTTTLLDNPAICAFCYTQLYDVEQEVNGLLKYDRTPKFDPAVIRRINARPAAIENGV
ncbi:MAG: beta-galactosidase, partial [Alicyclobacillus sp.]|nr:beta-galactosidase [Alicyclobacillus sp.]